MQAFSSFLAMGGYGMYVWSAFLASVLVLALMLAASLRRLRHVERMLDAMRETPAEPAGINSRIFPQ